MAIHWSLDRLEQILPAHVYSEMTAASCNPAVPIEAGGLYPIIHGETGNMLAGVPYEKGLRVPRSKMRALCAQGIDVQVSSPMTVNMNGSQLIAQCSVQQARPRHRLQRKR